MGRFDLDCYYIDEVSSSIATGCILFFRNIFTLTSSYSSIYIFMHQKILHYHLGIYKHQKVYI